jgi:hypothetical protein
MRAVLILTAILLSFSAAVAGEIREFSVPTLERLGNELYRRDQIAARASDAVLQTQPVARSLKMRGSITDLRKDGDMVYLIAETSSGPTLTYTVTFHDSTKPDVQDVGGQPLPPKIAVRYKARQTAAEALKGKLYNIGYNFEVLNDPDGTGFLVYALGSTGKRDEVVVCGHFRVTVSGDGEKAERIDALSRSLLINKMGEGLPRGTDQVGMGMAQIVSEKPVETLVYTNRLTGQLIVLKTFPHGQVWIIENGKITQDKSEK